MKNSDKIRQSIALFEAAESFKERTAARVLLEEVLKSAVHVAEAKHETSEVEWIVSEAEYAVAVSQKHKDNYHFVGHAKSVAEKLGQIGS